MIKTVFTDGVFDLFHANHAKLLQEARAYGDRLIVGVVPDWYAREYKRQPVISEENRLAVVQAVRWVDEAFIIEGPLVERTMEGIIAAYDVTAVVYAGDATPEFYRPAEARGIMHRPPYHDGITSSAIIETILARQAGTSAD